MDESKKALIAEVQEVMGKGEGEQPIEMPLARLTREVGQLRGGGRMQLGSPGWYWIMCPQCKSELRYELVYEIPYYYPPVRPLSCPVCNADLGVSGNQVMVLKAEPWPPALPPTYTCPHCGATLGSQAELDAHVASEHPAAPPPPPLPPPPGFKLIDWLKTYWPHMTVGGLSIALVGALIAKYGKKR